MVENNRTVYQALQSNVRKLALSNVALRCEDGLKFARQENGLFDVVFLDPPFKSDYLPQLLPLLEASLAQGGVLFLCVPPERGPPQVADQKVTLKPPPPEPVVSRPLRLNAWSRPFSWRKKCSTLQW